jgi:serine/threonine-protein kinase HipA
MTGPRKLDVYRGTQLVGELIDEAPLKFVYSDLCLQNKEGAIAPNLDLSQAEYSGDVVEAFFENLLPEGKIRKLLSLKYHTTTTFGLLSEIGGDSASNLTVLPQGKKPEPPSYQDTTWESVNETLHNPYEITQAGQADEGIRISLAGAQRKITLAVTTDGTPSLPLGNSPSTYILKPDIMGIENVWSSAINETFVMSLARSLNIGVAEVSYQPIVKACLVKRYDRIIEDNGNIRRLHQLDLCQLDGKPSTIKYESDGGPSLLRCRELLSENGVPAADMKRFLQWVFFNLFVGNNDGHAKNLSIYYPPDQGVRLAPFYDLLCTSIYSGLSRKFAFKIGGENIPGDINRDQITQMAGEMNFKAAYVFSIANEIAGGILRQIDGITSRLTNIANIGSEKTLLSRLNRYITQNTQKLQKRWN